MKDDTISRAAALNCVYGTSPNKIKGRIAELPSATDTNVGGNLISKQAALDAVDDIHQEHLYKQIGDKDTYTPYNEGWADACDRIDAALSALPSAQPNLSEAYSKAVFTWLMDYQIRAAELKGRYTPYEVLSWVINDWRKENE